MRNKKLLFILTFICSNALVFAQNEIKIAKKSNFSIGETIELNSSILNETRTLNIYLPNNYQYDSTKTYPVIYLLDGSTDEDFIHIAGLVQFGSFSWINMIPETIVVGISNIDRKRDFTYPTNNAKDKKDFPTTGSSEKFIQFIKKELQPLIDKNYQTNSIKTIIGQSLGGLLATEILFKQPDLFDNYIIVSPSLWWDDESLLATKPKDFSSKKSIYIGVGKEGKVMEGVAKQLFKKLKKDKPENTTLHFKYFKALNHGDTLHLAAYDAFKKLFMAKDK